MPSANFPGLRICSPFLCLGYIDFYIDYKLCVLFIYCHMESGRHPSSDPTSLKFLWIKHLFCVCVHLFVCLLKSTEQWPCTCLPCLTEQIGCWGLVLIILDCRLFYSCFPCAVSNQLAHFLPDWWDHWSLGQHYESLAGHEGPAAVCGFSAPRLQTPGLFLYCPTCCEVVSLIKRECQAQIQWYTCSISKHTSTGILHCSRAAVAYQRRHRLAKEVC